MRDSRGRARVPGPDEEPTGFAGAKEAAKEKLEDLKETASEYLEQGRDLLSGAEKGLRRQVKAEPMKALLIAAGIGLVVGFIWKRR